jgi:hypothetical protein
MAKRTNLIFPLGWMNAAQGFICFGAALLMMATACSRNNTPMADKNGVHDAILRPNDADTSTQWVRILVRLKVAGLDPLQEVAAKLKDPAEAKAADQQMAQMIAAVADRVLKMAEPAGAKLIRRFDTLPLLALQATPQAVTLLKSMPEVLAVEADRLNPPAR